jgi:hypothetical protein
MFLHPAERYNVPDKEYDAEVLLDSKTLFEIIDEIAGQAARVQIGIERGAHQNKIVFSGDENMLETKIVLTGEDNEGAEIEISVRPEAKSIFFQFLLISL